MFNKYKNTKEEIMEETMLEKGKSYTYEELEKIFKKAQAKAIENLDKMAQEAMKEKGKNNSTFNFAFLLQNIMVTAELYRVLFKGEKDNE